MGAVGSEARPQLSAKKVPLLFLLPFDAEAFKTCKNTIKLINLCALGLGLWLTLTVYFDLAWGGGENFTFQSFQSFSVSGDSKQKKISHKKSGP